MEFPGETVDGPQRSTQVVRDGVTERFHLSIRGFKLDRPLPDADLQLGVELVEFVLSQLFSVMSSIVRRIRATWFSSRSPDGR